MNYADLKQLFESLETTPDIILNIINTSGDVVGIQYTEVREEDNIEATDDEDIIISVHYNTELDNVLTHKIEPQKNCYYRLFFDKTKSKEVSKEDYTNQDYINKATKANIMQSLLNTYVKAGVLKVKFVADTEIWYSLIKISKGSYELQINKFGGGEYRLDKGDSLNLTFDIDV